MKTRFRIKRGWFGRSKVVLQVAYVECDMWGPTPWLQWRDATEEDMQICFPKPDPCPGDKAQDSSTEN